MLTEMAAMSCEDGLVMQIHPGSHRNHNRQVFDLYGRDKGFDIPTRTNYVSALQPLLDRFGMDPRLSIILFTLDETAYSRELAPLAGAYPTVKLGPAWWFFRQSGRDAALSRAGHRNGGGITTLPVSMTTRAPCRRFRHAMMWPGGSIVRSWQNRSPQHRINEDEAREVAIDLAYGLAKRSYNL